jgi:hypothetical protein
MDQIIGHNWRPLTVNSYSSRPRLPVTLVSTPSATRNASRSYFRVVPHTMNRIDISTGVEFDKFRVAFEKAAPPFDPGPVLEIAARAGSRDEVLAAAAINAPNGLMVYATIDALPLLSVAGHTT